MGRSDAGDLLVKPEVGDNLIQELVKSAIRDIDSGQVGDARMSLVVALSWLEGWGRPQDTYTKEDE